MKNLDRILGTASERAARTARNTAAATTAIAYVNHLDSCPTCKVARKHDLRAQCGQPVEGAVEYCPEGKTLAAAYLAASNGVRS